MSKRSELEKLFRKHHFDDFRWIEARNIVVSQWVRMKCMFGCREYAVNACCPPNTPSVEECRSFFKDYKIGVVFHFAKKVEKPGDRHRWTKDVNKTLLGLEREVFLAGNPKAFLLVMDSCSVCKDCTGERVKCRDKKAARPTPEAMAVDVFSSVRQLGYPIDVLRNYSETMNRYAFLLIE